MREPRRVSRLDNRLWSMDVHVVVLKKAQHGERQVGDVGPSKVFWFHRTIDCFQSPVLVVVCLQR
jgi:hypothetical protein